MLRSILGLIKEIITAANIKDAQHQKKVFAICVNGSAFSKLPIPDL